MSLQGCVGEQEELAAGVGWFDVIANIVMQACYWPDDKYFDFDWDWSHFTQAQRLMRSSWIAAWVPLLIDIVLLCVPTPTEGKIARYIDPVGKAWLSIAGATILGTGLAGTIMGLRDDPPSATGYTVAGSVLGPLPATTTFPLLFCAAIEGSEGVTGFIKGAIDLVCDIGAAVIAAVQ